MSLERFTMGHMPGLAKLVRGTIAMLRSPEEVHGSTTPLAPCEPGKVTTPISHSLVSKLFHTGHVAAPIIPGCLLLRLGT
jgi:hypothetical protein